MYLYTKKDDRIDVYSFEPKEDLIKEYKRLEMNKIPKDQQVLKAVTNDIWEPLKNAAEFNKIIPMSELNYSIWRSYWRCYHQIKKYGANEQEKAKAVLKKYYNQMVDHSICVAQLDDGSLEYLLLTDDIYHDSIFLIPDMLKGTMRGIIQIPESLYVLQKMYYGNGVALNDYEIDDQKELFEFYRFPVASFSTKNIDDLAHYGIVRETLSQDRLNNNQELVKKLKNVSKGR